ncbi:MAG: RNase adaptor protein RapZ [Thioalkalivibrio sp.]|nr:RNase adaptor protein RapZ [Thioalkalivibrio sp.]
MRLLLVSGLSGSGKTVALRTLEDEGFFCVDNLPLGLLDQLIEELHTGNHRNDGRVAVGVDVRSGREALREFGKTLANLRSQPVEVEVIFLQSSNEALLRRYHHTRRRHPLARKGLPLVEAIALEREWLGCIAVHADLSIDSSDLSMHDLARTVEPGLRDLTGLDGAVVDFLEAHADVSEMFDSIQSHLGRWLPSFARDHRSYLTVAIGCTGGRHRSAYLVDRLAKAWQGVANFTVSTRHRELDDHPMDAE